MKTIRVVIKPGGDTSVKVDGHPGKGCKSLTTELEKALGTTTQDKNTSEYYMPEAKQTQQQTLGMGN